MRVRCANFLPASFFSSFSKLISPMTTVTINGKDIIVPEGVTIIQACEVADVREWTKCISKKSRACAGDPPQAKACVGTSRLIGIPWQLCNQGWTCWHTAATTNQAMVSDGEQASTNTISRPGPWTVVCFVMHRRTVRTLLDRRPFETNGHPGRACLPSASRTGGDGSRPLGFPRGTCPSHLLPRQHLVCQACGPATCCLGTGCTT